MDVGFNLLFLHQRYTPEDQRIWAAALKRGWKTERIGTARIDIERKLLPRPKLLRYYGNVLHIDQCKEHLPIKFPEIDPINLTKLPNFTGRKIELMTAEQVQRPLTETAFYKCPGIKWIESRVYKTGETFDCKISDLIYKQSPIDIRDEIRCFIVDGKILTASWYRINKEFLPEELVDPSILKKLQKLTSAIWKETSWPRGVVFDFARLTSEDIVFLEVNESWASGLYECDPNLVFDSIIESQT